MKKKTYMTKQKKAILEFFKNNSDLTINAKSLHHSLKELGYNFGIATIYRHLKSLNEEGYLQIIITDDIAESYNFIKDRDICNEHFHLKCSSCGDFIHLECDKFDNLESHISQFHGFNINWSETVLYGICDNCKK